MKLYYSPGACSLASHIALIEGGKDFEAVKVDLSSHETEKGDDFYEINPRGYVPAIDTGDCGLITENPAVLTYLAENTVGLPAGEPFYRILEWLGFIGTELHGAYHPLFGDASDEQKDKAKKKLAKNYKLVEDEMNGSDWLVGEDPTVADNYLFVTLTWAENFGIELPDALVQYRERNKQRDAVQKAMKAEGLS